MNLSKEEYEEIGARGCIGRVYEYDPINEDGECVHGYDWPCEDCPVSIENEKRIFICPGIIQAGGEE